MADRSPRFISVDDHVQEPPDLWTSRLSTSQWGERIPHLERTAEGGERWVVDGQVLLDGRVASAGGLLPERGPEPARWDEVPRAAYLPAERLKAMNTAGVDYSVLFPTVAGMAGETFGRLEDPALEQACVRAYNDWLIEEWVSISKRFIPQCIVPIYPVEATVAEIQRAVAKGHRGVVYPAIPMHLREVPHINDPQYDPVWATCQDLGVPVCFHAGSSAGVQLPPYSKMPPRLLAALQAVLRPASAAFDVANILFSRILLRHPDLKVVFAESTIGWGSFLLEYADHQFEQDRCEGYELKPSEEFKRQCFFTSWYDRVQTGAHYIGTGNIMWSANFPMANSSWPNSRHLIERCFRMVSEDERRRVLWENAAKLYEIP